MTWLAACVLIAIIVGALARVLDTDTPKQCPDCGYFECKCFE